MISKIYHLADLHIRKGSIHESRYDEYKQVFDNCIEQIRETYIPDESVCVICGDIFHHKLQISSNGIILFNDFVSSLASLMKIFIVQGNHDLIQENDDNNNDLIQAMLSNKFSNVVYLDTTGTFQYDNLNFGVVSIKDMLKQNTSSGLVDELPTFPEPKDKYFNIALSHCTVKNSYLHNYTKNTNGIPIEWFKGYHIAMLGDIHLQTTKYNKANNLYYGYPGSLIQQDFGESLFNHGFLEWNISSEKITVNKHHVHNKIGKVNIKLSDENQLLINANNYIPFHEFLKLSGIPYMLHIRLYIKSNIDETIRYITSELQKISILCKIDVIHSHFLSENYITRSNEENDINISELNSTNTIIEFFKKYENKELYEKNTDWKLLFSNYDSFLIPESKDIADIISEKIKHKNEKLRKHTDTLVNTTSKDINTLNIKGLEFDWILSFGKGNKFVFDKDRIVLINAPNGYGKSAFLECITIALFGESIPSRHNKHTSISIINKSKPYNCDTSNTKLSFSLNNNDYMLIRVFYELKDSKNKDVKRLFSKNVELYENGTLIKSGATVVNKWILSNICSIDDFLLSSMISQNFDQDFFKFKPQDQMNKLDTFLKMENINSLSVLLKDSKKEYNDIRNHIQTYITANLPSRVSSYTSPEEIQAKISEISSIKQEIHLELQQVQQLQSSSTISVPDDFKPKISCNDLIQRERIIQNEINKLQIPFQGFTTYEINVSDPSKYIKDNFNSFHSKVLECDLKTDLKQIVDELNRLTTEHEILEYHLELHCNKKPLITVSRDDCNTFFHSYDKYHKLYSNYQVPCELNYTLEDVESINYDESLINNTIEELKSMLNDKSNSKNKDCILYFNKDCWACRKNMTDNEDILNTIEYLTKKDELKRYTYYLQHKQDIDKYNVMKKEKTTWDSLFEKVDVYEKWLAIKTAADEKIEDLGNQISYKQTQLYDAYNFQTKYNELVNLHNELETLLADKQYYIERKKTLQIQIDHLIIQERDAYVELSKYQIDKDNCCNFEITQKKYNNLLELLTNRIELFDHFMITIKKYKTWIYEDKLLPLVVKKTNKLLSFIYIQRPLELKFKFIENLVYYTIMDEGNEINIEKLSGAQSFAISLSFRLALASIGISKISCNQLFIDEGFCSYDEENLSKVPSIFSNIKKMYSSILFVSHLEDIKTCADKIVHIHRENGVSKIYNETT